MRAIAATGLAMCACGRVGFGDGVDARPDSVPPGFCATATFANLAASNLHDDFTTPVDGRWKKIPATTCVNQVGTSLVAMPPASMPDYCIIQAIGDTHLTCDSIFVHVPEVTTQILRVQTFVFVSSETNTDIFAVLTEGTALQMGTASAPYDPVLDAWWRLTERDGEVVFDTSSDASAWRERMRMPTPVSFDHVRISLGAGTYDPAPPNPGQARFSCYNTPPPCN